MNIKMITNLSVAAGLLMSSLPALADCTASTQTVTKTFTPSSVTVLRNATPGTVVSNILNINETNLGARCDYPGTIYMMFRYGNTMEPVTGTGIPAGVYKTNVKGIGVRVWNDYKSIVLADNILQTWFSNYYNGPLGGASLVSTHMQLIVTGPVSTGTIIFPDRFIEAWLGQSKNSDAGATDYIVIDLNNVTVKVPTCETPDITVELGKHDSAEFSGINSKSAAKIFNFEIKNCDPGLNSVNYTFKPAAGITLQQSGTANQYITLDASSTASGVGIQVLYNDDSLVPFNSKIKYTGYQTSTGGSYAIPMKARYIQTAGTISGGTANSAVEFTMSYE